MAKNRLTAYQRAQKKIQADKHQADKIREINKQIDPATDYQKFKNMTASQLEAWATKATKINSAPKAQGRKANYRQFTGE